MNQNIFARDAVMRSALIIIINLLTLLALSIFPHDSQAIAPLSSQRSNKSEVFATLYEEEKGFLNLKYISQKRIILVESLSGNISHIIAKLEKNANPELVGAEGDIGFLLKSLIHINGRTYVAVSYSKRSTHGDGSGQCGAGVERYFVSLELEKNTLTQRNKFLIESCKEGIVLAEESKEMKSIFLEGENSIVFNWINYPGYEGPVTGRFFFKENKLSLENRGWSGFTEQNSERQ